MELNVDVYWDAICPWCYIGKHRLDRALAALDGRYEIRVRWRPFQLNPAMPREGMDRMTYRSAKFGSRERSLALDAKVEEVGRAEGVTFAHERIRRTPNTFDAHRLVSLAREEGAGDTVIEALFLAYFVEGVDIGDRRKLAQIGGSAGLDASNLGGRLESEEAVDTVRTEEERARRIGVNSVPFFLIEGKYGISGAQESKALLAAFEKVARLTGEQAETRHESRSVAG